MNERGFGSRRKLTGVWQGLYNYPSENLDVPFTATLIEAGTSVSGSIHEPCLMYGAPNETLYATVLGRRDNNAVSFVKTYDVANPNYGSVNYEGMVNDEGTEIEGRWTVPGDWSGRFLMIRSGDLPEAVSERTGAMLPSRVKQPVRA